MDHDTFYRKLTEALVRSDFQLQASGAAQRTNAPQNTTDVEKVVQQRLDKLRGSAQSIFLKFVLAQPVIVTVVEADKLQHEKIIDFSRQLDGVVSEMRDLTGRIRGARLSVTGIILSVFFDPQSASSFVERSQAKCKIQHFFRKTWVLPWVLDVARKTVNSHRGLPFLPGVIDKSYLQDAIFQ